MNRSKLAILVPFLFLVCFVLFPDSCFADLESSLMGIKSKVSNVILPTLSVIGVALAAISFYTGNPQAKQHMVYAIIGCMFGFGAQAIVNFIRDTVK